MDYEAFGQAWEYVPNSSAAPSVTTNLRFPGQYYDDETGLAYNHNRYYESLTGRYTSGDPLGLGGGDLTLFTYAASNPLVLTDPTGLTIRVSDGGIKRVQVPNTQCPGKIGCTFNNFSYEPTACRETRPGSCKYKFDVNVISKYIQQYSAPQNTPNKDGTIRHHENLHVADFRGLWGRVNEYIPTEGFESQSACQNALMNIGRALQGYVDDMSAYTITNRDH